MNETRRPLYIALISIHGLIRGHDLELGRDADTGGQTKYVVELARALARNEAVDRVDLFTRQVHDARVSEDYAQPEEDIGENARIIRLACGPRRYLRKESLWPYLDEFADNMLMHFRSIRRIPDLVHGHYADAGYVGTKLSSLLGIPMVFTGHSLGRVKKERLLQKGVKPENIEKRYNISERIDAEEITLSNAWLVVTSTWQEVREQYEIYERYRPDSMVVIPPGIDLDRYKPPSMWQRDSEFRHEIDRFLRDPKKPLIMALSRADERKNLTTLVQAYAENPRLREMANLLIVAGNREEIKDLEPGARDVWTQLLMLIDKYNLYGSVAYPKAHAADDVPAIYQIASARGGVFVNPALTEPFGLTLLEAAASGMPVVATNDGGPRDILANCENGKLIDPLKPDEIGAAIEEILSDRSLYQRLTRNGLRGVHRYYSWDGHVQTYVEKVEGIMSSTKPEPFWVTTGKKLLQAERMVITDIDNTLLGQYQQESVPALMDKIHTAPFRVGFGIATGRHLDSAVKVLEENNVPRPDIFITSVGSEIHYGQNLEADRDWIKHINYRWQPEALRDFMSQFKGIELQPSTNQREHKISYYIDPTVSPSTRELIREMRKRGLFAKIIFSHGQFLDMLPIRASKGLAVWYLARKWGLDMNHVLVAGDSGNDEEMLKSSTLAVVVGNYSEELEGLRNRPGVYFAEGEYAWGIIEGIDHYAFFAPSPKTLAEEAPAVEEPSAEEPLPSE